jgi:hypothetical protein
MKTTCLVTCENHKPFNATIIEYNGINVCVVPEVICCWMLNNIRNTYNEYGLLGLTVCVSEISKTKTTYNKRKHKL